MRLYLILAVFLLVEAVMVLSFDFPPKKKRRTKKFKRFPKKPDIHKGFDFHDFLPHLPKKVHVPHKPHPFVDPFPHKFTPKKFVPHDPFPHKFTPKKFVPHDPFPHKFIPKKFVPHDPHTPHKGFSLGSIPHQLEKILAGTESGIQKSANILSQQQDFGTSLQKALGNQRDIDNQVKGAGKLVSQVRDATLAILNQQSAILAGQADIINLVGSEHKTTRGAVAQLGKSVGANIAKVSSNQATILGKIEDGRKKAAAGFDSLLRNKDATQNQLQGLVRAINAAGQANLDGQAGIIGVIRGSRDAVIKDLGTVIGRQGAILKRLDKSQDSVEKRIDAVFSRQKAIISSVQGSQKAVQRDLGQLKQEIGRTQGKIKASEVVIRTNIAQIRKAEAFTQHILDKCRDSGCDVGPTLDLITTLSKALSSIQDDLEKEIRELLANEAKTQGLVDGAEENVLRELKSSSDDTLHELKALGQELSALIHECEKDIRAFGKNLLQIENTQESVEHALIKIHHALDHLDLGKKVVAKPKRFSFF